MTVDLLRVLPRSLISACSGSTNINGQAAIEEAIGLAQGIVVGVREGTNRVTKEDLDNLLLKTTSSGEYVTLHATADFTPTNRWHINGINLNVWFKINLKHRFDTAIDWKKLAVRVKLKNENGHHQTNQRQRLSIFGLTTFRNLPLEEYCIGLVEYGDQQVL